MKILIMGDLHLADTPPSACTETYVDDLFDLLAAAAKVAGQRGALAAVLAGDIFHSKTPGRTSHWLVQRAIAAFRDFPCPVYAVPGNHDMRNDRFESVFESQPLGVVLRSGAARLLAGWSDVPSWPGMDLSWLDAPGPRERDFPPLYGVPWLQEWNDPEQAETAALAALGDLRSRIDGSHHSLVVTHAPFYQPGLELPQEFFSTTKFADLLPSQTAVYYGHVHERHGVYKAGSAHQTTFCNFGALSRGSLHEYNLTREPAVALWDSTSGRFEEVVLPHRPAVEVFRMTEVEQVKAAQVELDEFLSSIGQASIEVTSMEAVLAHVAKLELQPAVRQLVEELLTHAQGG